MGKPIKIITVHGTFAADESDYGDAWWQKGSDFQNQIDELVETEDGQPIEWEPFHWDGENSQICRREAGMALYSKLVSCSRKGQRSVLLAHSHGGSVVIEALYYHWRRFWIPELSQLYQHPVRTWLGMLKVLFLGVKPKLSEGSQGLTEVITGVVSVGTPFADFKTTALSHRGPIEMINNFRWYYAILLLAFYGLFLLLVSPFEGLRLPAAADFTSWQVFGDYLWNNLAFGQAFQALLAVLTILIPVSFLGSLEDMDKSSDSNGYRELSTGHSKELANAVESKWSLLFHSDDEARLALYSALKPNLRVFRTISLGNVFQNLTSGILLAIVWVGVFAFLFLLMGLYTETPNGAAPMLKFVEGSYEKFLVTPWEYPGESGLDIAGRTGIIVTCMVNIFVIYALLRLLVFPILFQVVVKVFDPAYRATIGNLFDDALTAQIRSTAFGSDLVGFSPRNLTQAPSFFQKRIRSLPQALEIEIRDSTAPFAFEAVTEIRNLLGALHFATKEPISKKEFAQSFATEVLIHNSYFRVERFNKLLAYSLCQFEGLSPSAKFKSDPDYALVGQWHQEITAGKSKAN